MTIFRFVPALAALLALTVVEPSPASAQGFDLAAQVRDKAALAVSQFQARAGGRLDYSEQSLATVEEMLAEASPYAKEMPPADVKALVELMGSYILEVGRRQHGGTYQWHEARSQLVLVVGPPKFSVAMMTSTKSGQDCRVTRRTASFSSTRDFPREPMPPRRARTPSMSEPTTNSTRLCREAAAAGRASRHDMLDRRLFQRPWSGESSQFTMGSGSRFGRRRLRTQAPTASRLMDGLLIFRRILTSGWTACPRCSSRMPRHGARRLPSRYAVNSELDKLRAQYRDA